MWMAGKREAREATDKDFVAINGFEFSENDGPGGVGHINVMNSDGMLNALVPGVDLPYFYKWLAAEKPNGEGPVVASFNHPGPHQYADFADRTPAATNIITMLEVINSNKTSTIRHSSTRWIKDGRSLPSPGMITIASPEFRTRPRGPSFSQPAGRKLPSSTR